MRPPTGQNIGAFEFVALMAMMFGTIAFSIDSLLPALPQIAGELDLDSTAAAASVMMAFMVGMGAGTLVMGPLSDAAGRKPLVYVGLLIYALGAFLCYIAPSYEMMLAARVLTGLGAAGPRVVSLAIIRDLYVGRHMASIMSFTMMVFLFFPGVAPLIGALLTDSFGWRSIFGAYLIFGVTMLVWFAVRVSETLPVANRRPLRWAVMGAAVREIATHRTVRLAAAVQVLMMTILLTVLSMVQPIFEVAFDRADTMPLWFGAIAVTSGVSSLLNARLVLHFGMRRLITWALFAQILASGAFILYLTSGLPGVFALYVIWQFGVMFQGGLTMANLNAIAMEPMGHVAGMASSVTAALSTIIAAGGAIGLGYLFDGTPRPLVLIVFVLCCAAAALMMQMRREEAALA
ncbi:MAG: MFS transporter [Pseudomonadota bacterium]